MKELIYKIHPVKSLILVPLVLISMFSLKVMAQKKDVIQFSGLVIRESDSKPIPYASIRVKSTYRGTIANVDGFFSIAIDKDDTIICSAVGFKKKLIVVPDDFKGQSFTTLISMKTDTITYKETVIYPWPSPAKFKDAFLSLQLDRTLYDLANENLSGEKMMMLSLNLKKDGYESQTYSLAKMVMRQERLGGQTNYAIFPGSNTAIPLSLLDPLAWYQFIKMLKSGGFKDKYKELRD